MLRVRSARFVSQLASAQAEAYKASLDFIACQQSKLQSEIDQLKNDPNQANLVELKQCELAYSNAKTHSDFENGILKEGPVWAFMQKKKWQRFVVPRLLKYSESLGIVGDAFPEQVVPAVDVQFNYPNVNWLGVYGHPVMPNWVKA